MRSAVSSRIRRRSGGLLLFDEGDAGGDGISGEVFDFAFCDPDGGVDMLASRKTSCSCSRGGRRDDSHLRDLKVMSRRMLFSKLIPLTCVLQESPPQLFSEHLI